MYDGVRGSMSVTQLTQYNDAPRFRAVAHPLPPALPSTRRCLLNLTVIDVFSHHVEAEEASSRRLTNEERAFVQPEKQNVPD